MKNHTRIYLEYFNYGEQDFIPSELSGLRANDLHHIENRKRGGDKTKDVIENIMALTREEHLKYGDKEEFKEWLKEVHLEFMKKNGRKMAG